MQSIDPTSSIENIALRGCNNHHYGTPDIKEAIELTLKKAYLDNRTRASSEEANQAVGDFLKNYCPTVRF